MADAGQAGSAATLPHIDRIQAAFGAHDVSGIRAFVGGPAARACDQLHARAYATGDAVAFREAPDLHLAAHEAAHVVQQRQGVHLAGGVGAAHDPYEQHADQVADAVVRGESAQSLLDAVPGNSVGAVQLDASEVQKNADELVALELRMAAAHARAAVMDWQAMSYKEKYEEGHFRLGKGFTEAAASLDLALVALGDRRIPPRHLDVLNLAAGWCAALLSIAVEKEDPDLQYDSGILEDMLAALTGRAPDGWKPPRGNADAVARAQRSEKRGQRPRINRADSDAMIRLHLELARRRLESVTGPIESRAAMSHRDSEVDAAELLIGRAAELLRSPRYAEPQDRQPFAAAIRKLGPVIAQIAAQRRPSILPDNAAHRLVKEEKKLRAAVALPEVRRAPPTATELLDARHDGGEFANDDRDDLMDGILANLDFVFVKMLEAVADFESVLNEDPPPERKSWGDLLLGIAANVVLTVVTGAIGRYLGSALASAAAARGGPGVISQGSLASAMSGFLSGAIKLGITEGGKKSAEEETPTGGPRAMYIIAVRSILTTAQHQAGRAFLSDMKPALEHVDTEGLKALELETRKLSEQDGGEPGEVIKARKFKELTIGWLNCKARVYSGADPEHDTNVDHDTIKQEVLSDPTKRPTAILEITPTITSELTDPDLQVDSVAMDLPNVHTQLKENLKKYGRVRDVPINKLIRIVYQPPAADSAIAQATDLVYRDFMNRELLHAVILQQADGTISVDLSNERGLAWLSALGKRQDWSVVSPVVDTGAAMKAARELANTLGHWPLKYMK